MLHRLQILQSGGLIDAEIHHLAEEGLVVLRNGKMAKMSLSDTHRWLTYTLLCPLVGQSVTDAVASS